MKIKKTTHFLVLAAIFLISFNTKAQSKKPKLVVGVVVDQMRYEYLYRFSAHYGATGFNRLLDNGFSLKNGHYNYIPTKTAPGHASIYSGTTPAHHGIIGNNKQNLLLIYFNAHNFQINSILFYFILINYIVRRSQQAA